ncbi:MAG: aldehyde dehydrogenase family protein [Polyangiaceae bacterium]
MTTSTELDPPRAPASARATEARRIVCTNPATREPLGEVIANTPAEVREIVARARAAQRSYARSTFGERRALLGHMLDHVLAHADDLCDVICRDAGKTRENAMMGEVWPVAEKLRHTMKTGERHLRPETVSAGLFVHKRARIEYHPLGVIGVICPWNYPMQNILGPTIPALFAGNAVVVKVSEHVAWSSARIVRIVHDALERAGLSRDLVQVVNGYGDVGAALVSSGVDKIVFTGSMPNGRKVVEESAKTLTPVILELGGKDAFIVCDDANIEQAAHAALAGSFIAAGQNCLAAERYLVFDAVYDAFAARVTELTRSLRQGPPLGEARVDVGAMVTSFQAKIVEDLVNDAVEKGAVVLAGGKRVLDDEGDYFAPTVLGDVPRNARILEEETFGPVIPLVRVRDEAEAIHRANETAYGLSCTILTQDRKRAERMARAVVAGGTSINDFGLTYMAMDLPFGGVRGSGYGRLNGREGLRAMTNVKSVLYDRMPNTLPAKLYPVAPITYPLVREVLTTIYGRSLGTKAKGLFNLLKLAATSIRQAE